MLSDFLENKLVDWLFRGQAYAPPGTLYIGLLTAAATDAGGITEVSYPGYARQGVASSLANWAGTQAAGSTSASTGTSGVTSNNAAITFPTPASDVATPVSHFAIFDAASAGNMLMSGVITNSSGVPSPKTLVGGDPVVVPIGALAFTVDVAS